MSTWINAMMNHRGENKQDTAIIIIISFISAHTEHIHIPAASRGYFDYKQSRVERVREGPLSCV
jgi:hypothetical protein